jgi:phospho-N-acetylmuramoyl-pentapeptide-transferase
VTAVLLASVLLIPLSALCSHALSVWMRRRRVGQFVREVGPTQHYTKAGTPTMGGIVLLFLWAVASTVLAAFGVHSSTGIFILSSGAAFAAIGAADDCLSLWKRRSLGLSVLLKILLSIGAAVLLLTLFRGCVARDVVVPFTNATIHLPDWAAFLLAITVFLATTNAVNLADGLDGLATGCSVLILLGALLVVPSSATGLIVPLLAILIGFLWVNAHPARLFLGDTGAYFLGGVIGAVALSDGTAFILPILAGVPALEVASVILQVGAYRAVRRRVFRMAPLHHHFEDAGNEPERRSLLRGPKWSEAQVVTRFLIAQCLFVALALLAVNVG